MQCNLYHAVCVCIYKNMFMQRKKRELNIWMILSFYLYIFFPKAAVYPDVRGFGHTSPSPRPAKPLSIFSTKAALCLNFVEFLLKINRFLKKKKGKNPIITN